MKKLILTVMLLFVVAGCQHGDLKIMPVVKGQPAPFSGYNISPEMYIMEGQPVLMNGVLVYVPFLTPEDVKQGMIPEQYK